MTTFYGSNYNNMRNIGMNDTFHAQQSMVETKKGAKAEEIIHCINGNFEKLLQIVIGSNDLYKKESEKNNKNMVNINGNFDFIFKSLKKLSSNYNERNLRMNELEKQYQIKYEQYQSNMFEKIKKYIGEQVNLLRFDLSLIYGDILKLFDEFANKKKNENVILEPQHDINYFELHDDAKQESELHFEYDVIQNSLISAPKIDKNKLDYDENIIDINYLENRIICNKFMNNNEIEKKEKEKENKIKYKQQQFVEKNSKNKRKKKKKKSRDIKTKPPDKIISKFVCNNAFISPKFSTSRASKDDISAQEILDIIANNYEGFKVKCDRFGDVSKTISKSLLLTSSGSINIKWLERTIRSVAGQRVYWVEYVTNTRTKNR